MTNSKNAGMVLFPMLGLLALAGIARADDPGYYDFHPMSILSLGMGYSPNDLSDAKYKCVNFTEYTAEPGSLETNFSGYFVFNSSQLKNVLKIDAKVDASYMSFKGGMTFNFSDEGISKSDSATLVVRAFTEYGRKMMQDPKLTEEAKATLESGDMKRFEKDCGSRIVAIERRGAMVAAIITISNLTQQQKASLGLEVTASGSGMVASFEARSKFEKLMESGSSGTNVRVQVVSTGGKGFSELGELVKGFQAAPDSLVKIETALTEFIKSFGPDNAAPIGYHTRAMGWGFDPNGIDLWGEEKQRLLTKLVTAYRANEQTGATLANILEGADPRAKVITPELRAKYEEVAPVIEDYMGKLAETHRGCRKTQQAVNCRLPAPKPERVFIPELPPAPMLLATPFLPGARYSDVEVRGDSVAVIEVLLNGKPIAVVSPAAPTVPTLVTLDKYWGIWKGAVRGGYVGALRITDDYGRKTVRVFHRGLYLPSGDATPVYDLFSRGGDL
jgi:hypothetical protein